MPFQHASLLTTSFPRWQASAFFPPRSGFVQQNAPANSHRARREGWPQVFKRGGGCISGWRFRWLWLSLVVRHERNLWQIIQRFSLGARSTNSSENEYTGCSAPLVAPQQRNRRISIAPWSIPPLRDFKISHQTASRRVVPEPNSTRSWS